MNHSLIWSDLAVFLMRNAQVQVIQEKEYSGFTLLYFSVINQSDGKLSGSPLWGAIRGTQRARLHGMTGAALAPAAQLPAMRAASQDGTLCLPEVGKEGEIWRATKSETVQH